MPAPPSPARSVSVSRASWFASVFVVCCWGAAPDETPGLAPVLFLSLQVDVSRVGLVTVAQVKDVVVGALRQFLAPVQIRFAAAVPVVVVRAPLEHLRAPAVE